MSRLLFGLLTLILFKKCFAGDGASSNPCESHQFKCLDGHCIPEVWKCDGERDCEDDSDENDCKNGTECHGFRCNDNRCIPENWKCDGQTDCSDGSDEELCPKKLCSEEEFTCSSGTCLNRSEVCNGKKDCSDGSDEGAHCGDVCANVTCSQKCRATPTGPECYCEDGYSLDSDNKTCSGESFNV
ncbi:hypothetical protein NPIL_118931 [Nephila pilipes]|uniref:Uncharacterized protein n=1 Tax=Nephila pilipes TaxID=299642 RepID=A0A8X6NYP7_NEPPI|nr:hypothetical protein NPIL_118931 [Nephila pilipes]